MIDEEIKELIYELESMLKKDSRFKENGDDQYRKKIRKIYQPSKFGDKPVDLTSLVNLTNLNNTVDIGDLAYINYINQTLIKAKDTINYIINN